MERHPRPWDWLICDSVRVFCSEFGQIACYVCSPRIWFCRMFLWGKKKKGFLHYLKLYPGLESPKQSLVIWAVFCKIIEVFGFVLPFPSPHFRIIIVLKLYFHIQLVRDSYCAAISNHTSFVRRTIAASGQSSERISMVNGTTLTLTRQCCL